ncbi:MAG TPA: GGDEF domain-containing protein [Casimicrobiaceae bacterium]|nr:GGDEF domain-containing protein [Casimicrobiaceae bacterium]
MLPRVNLLELYTLGYQRGLLVALLLYVATATLDLVTGIEISLGALYLFPILIATWNCGGRWGLVFALIAAVTQASIGLFNGYTQSSPGFFIVDNANRLATYLLYVLLAHQLRRLYDDERDAARVDDLTKVRNRKGFREVMQHEIYRHARSGKPFCVAYIDCDGFKSVNDSRGHSVGDELLRAIAVTLQDQLRRSDTIGRIGGDEFAVIFPETEGASLLALMTKVRHALTDVASPYGPVTFSIGMVTFPSPPEAADRAIHLADRAMYRAKASGKNGTVWDVYDPNAPQTVTRPRLHSGT